MLYSKEILDRENELLKAIESDDKMSFRKFLAIFELNAISSASENHESIAVLRCFFFL